MRPYELIKAKRDGKPLPEASIREFISGYTTGSIPDYQMAAMCMAIFFRGLAPAELSAWTRAMLQSGEVVNLADLPGPKVDKHSTGGVGDKVSLCLAPLVAACGVFVPMISGRGLGHTGGTLDKLESIAGFRTSLSVEEFRRLVREVGTCLIGQTPTLVPADKKLYALRDVTATVDCLPLIASSIMSKKVAEGIDALVLDVKVGSGAFMKTLDQARALARTMIDLGAQLGCRVTALLTDMNQPLGRAVGNALEVAEAIDVLRGAGPKDLVELTLALGAEMLVLGGVVSNQSEAMERLEKAIRSGSGLAKLKQVVEQQGGDASVIDDPRRLPAAGGVAEVHSPRDGFVTAIDAEAIGLAAMTLGAGRERVDSVIDPSVGVILLRKVGEPVQAAQPLAQIHYNQTERVKDVSNRIVHAFQIEPSAPPQRPLIYEHLR